MIEWHLIVQYKWTLNIGISKVEEMLKQFIKLIKFYLSKTLIIKSAFKSKNRFEGSSKKMRNYLRIIASLLSLHNQAAL